MIHIVQIPFSEFYNEKDERVSPDPKKFEDIAQGKNYQEALESLVNGINMGDVDDCNNSLAIYED